MSFYARKNRARRLSHVESDDPILGLMILTRVTDKLDQTQQVTL